MPILAMDTATMVSSVAIASADKLLAELTLQTKLTHSEVLMPHVAEILAMTKMKKSDLAGIAVSIGPGSFTGLRIGLAAAKSMAYALSVPIVGVSTLEAMAYHYPVPGVYTAAVLDAQKGNVYAALYEFQAGDVREIRPVSVLPFEEVLAKCQLLDKPVIVVGDIAQKKLAQVKAAGSNVIGAMPHMVMPRAANVAMLGLKKLAAGQRDNVMEMEPVYIRRSEAEVLWEQRQQRGLK